MAKVFGAAFHGKLSKLRKYLEAEDDTLLDCPSVDWADEQGTTALHAACQEGCTDCVELLLRAGAMAGRATAGGTTPLMLACENGRADCAELLLKAQADVSATDGEHRATALHGASQADSPACVELLLSHGANVDAADSEGATPLAIAAHRGHAHCVALLFNAGADDGARFGGKTALELAEEAGHAACAALLNGGGEGGGGDEGGEDDEAVIGPPRPPPTAANKLLSGLSSQLKQSGLGGADVIAEKEKELAEQEAEIKRLEAEAARKKATEKADAPTTAADAKARANSLFAAGKVAKAADLYEQALELLTAEEEAAGSGGGEGGGEPTGGTAEPPPRAVLLCNLAACQLRQRLWKEAVESCDAALFLHAEYTKALYRRAQARRSLREYDGAVEDAQAALAAAAKAGGGQVGGEVGRKLQSEITKFVGAVDKEAAEAAEARERQEREEFGITLGGDGEEGGGKKSVYYHYASQGEKTQDFMFFIRQQLVANFEGVAVEKTNGIVGSNGYASRHAIVRVGDFDPHEDSPEVERGALDGTCTIRHHAGRKSLFFDLSLAVPWRAYLDEGTKHAQSLGGMTKLWNVTHFNTKEEWKHLNHRNTHEVGPAMDAAAEHMPLMICAAIKQKVQEVLGMLMYERIDPALLLPPPKPERPKAASRAWGKGTVDYSKFDNIDDSDEEDERITDVDEM